MTSRIARLVAAGTVLLGLLLVPAVLAHGNILAVDSQHTTDGTVELEGAYTLTGSWAAVYTDDAGSPGEPIGHTFLSPNTFHTETTVAIDEGVWRNWSGARTVHVVMHNEDGDGEFDPAADPVITQSDEPVGGAISLARADRAALVAAERLETGTTTGNATVRRVRMPEDGRLVLHAESVSGQVVGERALDAGAHAEVTVPVDEDFYRYQGSTFTLTAAIYSGDVGDPIDGSTRLTAGERPVATSFSLEPANKTTPTPTASPDTTATGSTADAATTTEGGDGNGHDDHDHENGHSEEDTEGDSDHETTGPTTSADTTTVTGASTPADGDAATTAADAGGAGFGFLVGLLAVIAGALILGGRRA